MKIIRELIQIVTKKRADSIKIIDISMNKKTKVNIFYEAILNQKVKTDEEAALLLFNSSTNYSAYKNLKVELTERLINSLFFIRLSQPLYSEYQKSYFYCCKYMAIAKILRYLLAVETSINLFKRVLKRALKYERAEFIVECCLHLRQYYAIYKGDEDRFNYYHNLHKKYKAVLDAEYLSVELYQRLMLPFVKEKAIKQDTYVNAKNYLARLDKQLKTINSPHLYFIRFHIKVIMLLSINNYIKIIDTCKEVIQYFEQKDYTYKVALNTSRLYLVCCYVQLKQFEQGKALEEKTLKLLREGSHNWYNNRRLYFILAMHTKYYQEAYAIYFQVTNHRRFKSLPFTTTTKEVWQIYGAYLHFLYEIGKLKDVPPSKFKLGKFLNSVPTSSKDKNSVNISVIVIQILFMIVRKNYDKAIDKIESVEKYITRYIHKDQNRRSNAFIRMLLKVVEVGFNRGKVERRVKKYYTELTSVPLESINQIYIVEIIPYEDLWEMLIELLENRHYRM